MKKLFITLIVMVAMVGFSSAFAAEKMIEVSDGTFVAETANGIPFATGGVGIGERAAMSKIEKNYNVRIVFAVRSGAYLANIKTVVSDPNRKVLLNLMANGPWVFVKVPPGKYKVTATCYTDSKAKEITVGNAPISVLFHWSNKEGEIR